MADLTPDELGFIALRVQNYEQGLRDEIRRIEGLLAQADRDLQDATRGRVTLVRQQRDLQVEHQVLGRVHQTVLDILKVRVQVPIIPPRGGWRL